jgi:hypothetical protein
MGILKPSKLTVRVIKKKLGDHYLDFMNANNPNGFILEDDREIDETSLAGILITVAITSSIKQFDAREKAKLIYRLSGKRLTESTCRNYVSKALGYKDWTEARASRDKEGVIQNVRFTANTVTSDIYTNQKAGINLEKWPRDKPLPNGYLVHSGVHNTNGDLIAAYQTIREATDILLAENHPAGTSFYNWIKDENRNVLVGSTLVWVNYKDEEMYIPLKSLRLMAKKFKKIGCIRALWKIGSDHPLAKTYGEYKERFDGSN